MTHDVSKTAQKLADKTIVEAFDNSGIDKLFKGVAQVRTMSDSEIERLFADIDWENELSEAFDGLFDDIIIDI